SLRWHDRNGYAVRLAGAMKVRAFFWPLMHYDKHEAVRFRRTRGRKRIDPMRRAQKISLLIPVYNEVNSLEQLLGLVESVDFCGLEKELVIVDDGSEDGTRDILRRLEAQRPEYRIVYHAQNMGKGAALRTAIDVASGDIIAIQDAD